MLVDGGHWCVLTNIHNPMFNILLFKTFCLIFPCSVSGHSQATCSICKLGSPASMVKGQSLAVIGGKLTVLMRLCGWEDVARLHRIV